jgi:hypothetical protein
MKIAILKVNFRPIVPVWSLSEGTLTSVTLVPLKAWIYINFFCVSLNIYLYLKQNILRNIEHI